MTFGAIGSYYTRYYAVWAVVFALATVILWILRRRVPRRVTMAGVVVVGVLGARLILFDNPIALTMYQRVLTDESLGLRQWGVLDFEIKKYRREIRQPVLANLAVGSSQVGAIFYQWASPPPEPVGVYSLAGMKSLDFVLNEDAIVAMRPARLILYLSAFDMTGIPELFSLPLAPPQLRTIGPVYARLRASGLTTAELAPHVQAYVASQLLPEYRYSYVYRALIRQWFGAAPRSQTSGSPAAEWEDYFDAKWLEYNFGFLEDFLAFCLDRGIQVLVLEGQTNPAVLTPAIEALNTIVRERLRSYQAAYANFSYLPADAVYRFAAEEYHDKTHVLPDAAKRYTTRLSAILGR